MYTGALIWIALLLNFCLTSFGLWAAITANSSLKELRRLLATRSTRSLQQLDVEMAELSSALSSLSTTTRRISSRIGMQDVRARRKPELDPTQPMTKQELRAGLASGQLRVLNDNQAADAAQGPERRNGARSSRSD